MNKWLLKYFRPAYDETATFLMAVSFVLLYVADPELRQGVAGTLEFTHIPKQDGFIFMFSIILIAGFFLSIYHVFSKRNKTQPEKMAMLVFALTMNGVAAVTSGIYLLKTESGLLRMFTLWNVINGVALLYQIGLVNEDSFYDDQFNIYQICVGLIAVGILFYMCHIIFNLYWAVTFSICVCYASTISRFVSLKIGGK